MRVLAHRGTLGAMRAEVERAVPAGLLPCPDAILHLGDDGAADRAMGADRFHGLYGLCRSALRIGTGDGATGGTKCGQAADGKAAAAQERASVNGCAANV